MALLATVLLTILAATIVLAIATQAVVASRSESTRSDAAQATRAAADTQRTIEAWLAQSPYIFLSQVSPYERARVCKTGTVYQPGSTWPLATCGTSWTYQRPGTPGSVDGAAVEVDLAAPSSGSPLLGVKILATYGADADGLSLQYSISGSERFTLYSASDLTLDSLARGCSSSASCSTLSGTSYTAGTMFLPSSTSLINISAASQLEAEAGFSPTPASTSAARYYAATAQSAGTGTAQIRSLRAVQPDQLAISSLRSSVTRTSAVACPGGTATTYPADSTLTSLCLNAGASIPALYKTSAGGPGTVTVRPDVKAYMLLFNDQTSTGARLAASSPRTVSVYYTTTTPSPAGNCAVACDLTQIAVGDLTAGTSPGLYSYWNANFLGTFSVPRSGIIATDHDAYLSLCSSAGSAWPFTSSIGSCPALSGGATPGMAVGQSVTVLAGSSSSPADVYLSGPITAASGVSFGAVATGSVILPYWARPPGTFALSISGAYTALGYGVSSSTSAIRTFPAAVDATNANNVASSLTLTGSLAAPSVDLGFNMFSQVSLLGSSQLDSVPPPYFSDFSGRWANVVSTRLTPGQLCSSRTCSSY